MYYGSDGPWGRPIVKALARYDIEIGDLRAARKRVRRVIQKVPIVRMG